METKTLPLTALGNVPASRSKVFFRVSTWSTGAFVADFATRAEAQAFAISDARARGCDYDHSVAEIKMVRG